MPDLILVSNRFLSEEDLDLASLTDAEFYQLSAHAFRALQQSNEQDLHMYRHGCIAVEPGWENLLPLVRSGVL